CRNNIDAPFENVTGRMRVVGANVTLLCGRNGKPSSRQEEELAHLDVRWQPVFAQRVRVGEIRISTEQALQRRLDESALQLISALRRLKRQRRENLKLDRALGGGARIKGVGDMDRLAEC